MWILNGKELTTKDNVKFETNAQTQTTALVIPKVSVSHLGSFTIKAANQVGEAEFTFKMDVLGMFLGLLEIISLKIFLINFQKHQRLMENSKM